MRIGSRSFHSASAKHPVRKRRQIVGMRGNYEFADRLPERFGGGDRLGNLLYRLSARNFNPMMATAADVTLAEVEELVEPGTIDPNLVHTPGIYVDTILQGSYGPKRIEKRTNRPKGGARA